eukprot:4535641-Pleurochrysis_carterae.AAC.2
MDVRATSAALAPVSAGGRRRGSGYAVGRRRLGRGRHSVVGVRFGRLPRGGRVRLSQVVGMRRRWLRKHVIGVHLVQPFGSDSFGDSPALALGGSGRRIDVGLVAILGLDSVFVVAIQLPAGLGIDVADEVGAVSVAWMRFACVV